ncbi:MAG: FdhF/YdeP family oxidoreductase [Chloroflexi bacterium]|nr:MAG: FdhF/YdeP family oxidoreductase [Chloroflexota bacterium]
MLRPSLWVSLVPYGIGRTKPNHYLEILRTVWDNRHDLPYAWRILSRGVCDGCALGVAGFRDWTMEGIHLCTTRLDLLKLNTARALDPTALADVPTLPRSAGALRALGRLPYPMLRRRGEAGFRRVSWDDALDLASARVRATAPERIGLYLTARGLTNETYYAAQKVARFLGTNNIDNAARVCHAPSTGALRKAIGVAATTCSYRDVIESDLVVLFGADVANAQPVFMKYLYLARKRGTKVVVVNPLREPGLEHYWVPSSVESALFGTKMADAFFAIHTGADLAFVRGALKILIEDGGIDEEFVREHTVGFDELRTSLATTSLEDLAAAAGSTTRDLRAFASAYRSARSAVLVWSMGVTQHACGTESVQGIVDLALARGNVGRPGAGLMPIRGHSGVQGGAEMGAYATAFPGGVPVTPENARALRERYGFDVPSKRGLTAAEMVEAAGRGEIDVLWSSGGNFLETLPDPDAVRAALARTPLRVHQDIVVSPQMLVESDEVLLLPAMTRYEQPGGGTETTTERRVVLSPEIEGPRPGEARAEWAIFAEVGRRAHPERASALGLRSAEDIRAEIATVVPAYAGIQGLADGGDSFQWGGRLLCEGWRFPTADGRAHFSDVMPSSPSLPAGRYHLSTRRGKQFNSMVWRDRDPLTGASRDALFVSADDARALGVTEGEALVVRSESGATLRARAHIAPIRARNVQMFWPEANALIAAGRRDPVSGVPDYNAVVEITRA